MTFYKEVAPSKNKTGAVLGAEGGAGGDSTFATLGGPVLKEVSVYGHTYGGGLSHTAFPAPTLPYQPPAPLCIARVPNVAHIHTRLGSCTALHAACSLTCT